MACDLTLGRLEPCKESIGGIMAVYFINFDGLGTVAYDTGNTDAITDLGTGVTAYKYDLKSDENTYSEAINSSRENGTTFFEQNLSISLKGLTAEDQKEIRLLAYGRPHVVVHARNGEAFIAGLAQGCEVNGGETTQIGGAYGDKVGHAVTLQGREAKPANWLDGATTADPFAGLSNAPSIVSGS